jgi:hypothetical protein
MVESPQARSAARYTIALAAVAVCVAAFIGLGSYPLLDPDEPVYAVVARNMLHTGNYTVPQYTVGTPFFDKPPMFYWLASSSLRLFGENEFAVRFPSALMTLLTAGSLIALLRKELANKGAIMSALVFASTLHVVVMARAAVTDATLTFFLTMAFLAFWRLVASLENSSPRRVRFGWSALVGLSLGGGVLTKGPVALALFLITVLAWLTLTRQWKLLRNVGCVLAVLVFLLVAASPWHLAIYNATGTGFFEEFWGFRSVGHFAKISEHPGQTNYLYYFVVFALGVTPWLLPSVAGIARAVRSKSQSLRSLALLALCWIGTVFVIFTISKTKLSSYLLPVYPASAILVALMFSQTATDLQKALRYAFIVPLTLLVGVTLYAKQYQVSPILLNSTLAVGTICLLLASCATSLHRQAALLCAYVIGLVIWFVILGNVLGYYFSSKPFIREVHKHGWWQNVEFATFDYDAPSIDWYVGGNHRNFPSLNRLQDALHSTQPLAILTETRKFGRLPAQTQNAFQVLLRNERLIMIIREPRP